MIATIIPARGGSKGIPGKNIMPVAGKPLIAHSIEHGLQAGLSDGVYVSTDDDNIARVSKAHGARVIRRPSNLATDIATSESALLHAVEAIEKESGKRLDLVVFLQATSPVRTAADVDGAIETLRRENADSLFSGSPLADFCIWQSKGQELSSVSYDYKSRKRRQDFDGKYYLENGSIYVFKPDILRQYGNRLGGKMAIYEMEMWKSFEIDSMEGAELCEWYILNRLNKMRRRGVTT